MAAKVLIYEISVKNADLLTDLAQKQAQLKQEQQALKKIDVTVDEAGYKKAAQSISLLKGEILQAKEGIKGANAEQAKLIQTFNSTRYPTGSYNQLNATLIQLRQSYKNLSEEQLKAGQGTDLIRQIQTLDKELKKVDASLGLFQRNVGNYQSAFKGIAGAIGGVLGIQLGAGALQQIITTNAQLSDTLIDVKSAAGLSATEITRLGESLKSLDTRTALNELLKFAEIGGKAGVTKNLENYVEAVDKIKIALGKELGDNADATITTLTKLINIFEKGVNKEDGQQVGDALLRIGNGIQFLANQGVSTGGFLTDFAQRLAGLKGLLGERIDLSQIIGLGAGFEELGQSAEVSATAVSQVLSKIGQDVPKFARLAGVPLKEFAELVEKSPVQALIKLSEGLSKNKKGFAEISEAFKDAEFRGARVTQVIGTLGANTELFTQKLGLAAQGLSNTDLVLSKSEEKQKSFAATLERIRNLFTEGFTSPAFLRFLTAVGEALIPVFQLLGAVFNLAVNLGGAIFGNAESIRYFTGQTNKYNEAQENTIKLAKEAQSEYFKQRDATQQYFDVLKNGKSTEQERQQAILQLQALAPATLKNLDLEKLSLAELQKAQAAANEELKRAGILKLENLKKDFETQRIAAQINEDQAKAGRAGGVAVSFDDKKSKSTKAELEKQIANLDFQIKNFDKDIKKSLGGSVAASTVSDEQAKAAESLAKKLDDLNDLQKKRIEEIRKDIDSLKATEITNEFDKKKQETINRAESELIQLEQRLRAFEEKAKLQGSTIKGNVRDANVSISGGGVTAQDQTEAVLINQETVNIRVALEKQKAVIEQERQKAFDKQAQQIDKLAIELRGLQIENAKIDLETTKQAIIEGFDSQIDTVRDKAAEKNAVLVQQLRAGAITEKEFNIQRTANEAETAKQILAIQIERLDGLKSVNRKVLQAEEEFIRDRAKVQQDAIQERLQNDELKVYDELKAGRIKNAEEAERQIQLLRDKAAQETFKIENKAEEDIKKLKVDSAKSELDATKQITEAKVNENQREYDNFKALQEKKKKDLKELKTAALDIATNLSNTLFDIEKLRIDKEKEESVTALDKQYKDRIALAQGNTIEQERLTKELEAKKLVIEKEAAEKRKKLAITEAVIGGALAAVKALPNPFAVAAVAVATLANIALINKQRFAKGGVVKLNDGSKVSRMNGATHAGGGTNIFTERGEHLGNVERNEIIAIVNAKNSNRIGSLSDLNTMNGNGVSFGYSSGKKRFADGGVIPVPAFFTNVRATGSQSSDNGSSVVTMDKKTVKYLANVIASETGAKVEKGTMSGINTATNNNERKRRAQLNATF